MSKTAILLITCPDRKGLVAAIANFLLAHDANILHADQHQDHELGLFFMRVEFDLAGFQLEEVQFRAAFAPIADANDMTWQLEYGDRKPIVAIFVSQYLHCVADLLLRHASEELRCDIAMVISNHREAEPLAKFYGIPFHFVPVTAETRGKAELAEQELLSAHSVDLIVLARYMQILTGNFVENYPRRIINVHHSFLPAFTGARPYHAAFARGVKLIGATSHYVTEVLDDGSIIEQDVTRISHSDQIADLIQKGRDLERIVLSRAVRWHLEHRILCYANKTVVF
jgi:formyltetrahydrofolate deformylase